MLTIKASNWGGLDGPMKDKADTRYLIFIHGKTYIFKKKLILRLLEWKISESSKPRAFILILEILQ